jgi:hypothetical protein
MKGLCHCHPLFRKSELSDVKRAQTNGAILSKVFFYLTQMKQLESLVAKIFQ